MFVLMNEAGPVLEAHELSRSFGRQRAVERLTFSLGAGESLALFGPNGAGKTTTLRLLAGLLRPSAGQATIGGTEVRSSATVRGRVGLISHQSMLYPALTALENVEFAARLHGVDDPRGASHRALETLGVAGRASSAVRTLSRGLQQRVSIARSIVHRPAVLLLDEPYTGLDASGAAALSDVIHGLRSNGATMVLVTHNVGEGLAVASHAALMFGGRLVRLGPAIGLDPAGFAREYRDLAVANGDAGSMAVA
jgi:heme ABC exporter ATP-binding subunit CcmA